MKFSCFGNRSCNHCTGFTTHSSVRGACTGPIVQAFSKCTFLGKISVKNYWECLEGAYIYGGDFFFFFLVFASFRRGPAILSIKTPPGNPKHSISVPLFSNRVSDGKLQIFIVMLCLSSLLSLLPITSFLAFSILCDCLD